MTSDELQHFIDTAPDVTSNWFLILEALRDAADEIERLTKRITELEKPPEQWTVSDRRDGYIIGICPMCEATRIVGEYEEL